MENNITPLPEECIRERLTVPEHVTGDRLDRYVSQNFRALPFRKSALKAIKRGDLLVNGREAEPNQPIQSNDEIVLLISEKLPPVFPLDLHVLWEDEWLAVVVKPPGFAVSGCKHHTIENALPVNLRPSEVFDRLVRPRPVHRLDAPTGGILLVAKSASALTKLSRQFEIQRVEKRYRALVNGHLNGTDTIMEPVDGKHAETIYYTIQHTRSLRAKWITLVDLVPKTGRTHQLRKHLSWIGHPIVGDTLYGIDNQIFRGKGLFLWAISLSFDHPDSGEKMIVEIDEPPKFKTHRDREARRWRKYHD